MNGPLARRLHFLLCFFIMGSIAFLSLANATQAAQVTLAWSPNTESDVAGYRLHYGTASRHYKAVIDIPKTEKKPTCTVSDLVAGKTYYFSVTAYNNAGQESRYSGEIHYSVPNGNPTQPSAPSGPSSGLMKTDYSFSTSAADPDGHSLRYRYNWGDGVLSGWGTAKQSHSWKKAGYYRVMAQVQDRLGALSAWSACSMVMIAAGAKDSDGDGIPDDLEINYFRTNPNSTDTDGDGIPDGQEVAFWGQRWNGDIDGDGIINLLDWDADGDGLSDGEEVANGTDAGAKGAALPMEAGEVKVGRTWKQVNFGRQFFNPVVVAGGMSANDPQTAVVRIGKVTGSGFEIRVQEWDCYDGVHAEETVGYLAVESGVHTLAGNLKVEAGQFVHRGGKVFIPKAFQDVFPETPVVMAAVTTVSDPAAVVVRLNEITTQGFKIRLQEQEANVQNHGAEMISYIAWQPSSGSFGGIRFEVDNTAKVVDHKFTEIPFLEPHATEPVFLGQMQSTYGRNTAGVQWWSKDAKGVEVRIAEETSRDRETRHALEVVGFMAFSAVQ